MTIFDNECVQVSTPGQVAEMVPHLLGFHPEDSLVVIVADVGRVVCTARLDLDAACAPGELGLVLERLASSIEFDGLLFVAVTPQRAAAVRALDVALIEAGAVAVGDLIWMNGERWESLRSGESGMRNPAGLVATQLTAAGKGVASSRAALTALVECRDPLPEWPHLVEVAARQVDGLDVIERQACLSALLMRPAGALDAGEIAELAHLLADPSVRDVALAALDRKQSAHWLAYWLAVVGRIPAGRLAAQPVALLGMSAWLDGQGALMTACLERAEQVGGAPLVRVLAAINQKALPPSRWDVIRAHLLTVDETGEVGA